MEKKRQDTGRNEQQKKPPVTHPARKEPPKRHEQAPLRNPAPTRPASDSDPSGVPRERDVEGLDDRERDQDDG